MTQQTQQVVPKGVHDIEDYLWKAQNRIAEVLPAHIAPAKMITVALELVRGDSALTRCLTSQEGCISIVQGVLEASQLGLLLTRNLGHAYLVPFKHGALSQRLGRDAHLAQMMIGYRGFIHLVRQGNENVAHVYSRVVYVDEAFDIDEGSGRALHHKPNLDGGEVRSAQDGALSGFLGAYAMCIFKDSAATSPDFEWMPLREIQKCRNAAKAKQADTPWFQWPEEMVKKTPIRRLCKRLELTPELTAAVVRDEYRELVGPEHQLQPAPRMQMPRRRSETVEPAPETHGEPAESGPASVPDCPDGHGPMQFKGGKFGSFYGCQQYPKCRKTVKVSEWEKQQAQNQKPAGQSKDESKVITKAQAKALADKAAEHGWKLEESKKLLAAFGYDKSTDVREADHAEILRCIEAGEVPSRTDLMEDALDGSQIPF